MALAAAACTGGMHRRIPNQGALSNADKEIAESRRVRQLEYKSKALVYGNGKLGFHCSCSHLDFGKEGIVFRAGETISASYVPKSMPINFPDLNGVKMELELKMYFKDPAAQMSCLVRDEKFSLGDGCTKSLGPNKEVDYTFSFTIPSECPSSYEGTFGSLTYTLTRVEHQSAQDIHSFDPMEVTIMAKSVPEWEEHKRLMQPMFAQKQVSTFLFGGKIQMSLSTDQQCYEPGDNVQFALKVKNGGGKGIRTMSLQLQQNVIFNSGTCVQIEKILFPQESGPSVSPGGTENWAGNFELPRRDLEPSIGDRAFNILRNAYKLDSQMPSILYEYFLRVTFEMVGSLVPNIIEEFPIDIGTPVRSTETVGGASAQIQNVENLAPSSSGAGHCDGTNSGKDGTHHFSMTSLAPSLPDYEAATSSSTRPVSWDGSSGSRPPAYSCLEIESHQVSVSTGTHEYI